MAILLFEEGTRTKLAPAMLAFLIRVNISAMVSVTLMTLSPITSSTF
jgi:hypothetical protein